MKRFRYKGDLSKHIKRYHPGHTQALTPVPLQEDEIATMALTNKPPTAKSVAATVSSSPSIQIKASSIVSNVNTKSTATSIGTTDNKFFLPLCSPTSLLSDTNSIVQCIASVTNVTWKNNIS